MATGTQTEFARIQEQIAAKPAESLIAINTLCKTFPNDADSIKVKEQAMQLAIDTMVHHKQAEALRDLLTDLRPWFVTLPKAKTAKLIRNIIEAIAKIPDTTALQLEVCKEQVQWAKTEKRTFLRQRIEVRLANLSLASADYSSALSLVSKLLSEVKRLDDKLLLVDIHLLESKIHHALRNQPKAKAALTAARTAANAIYIPPTLQAEIDTQSGVLHAEEKDYKTAYSYFFEAFEQFNALDDKRAVLSLKYMLLCKVMTAEAHEVNSIISSKAGLKYPGLELDAMKAVAKAYEERSLQQFQETLHGFSEQLVSDPVVHGHLSSLYDTLLEQNLCRLIEPFSRVEIEHIAGLIKLPVAAVEAKLSQMILDKKFSGTLDQGAGCLEVFDDVPDDPIYPVSLETYEHMGSVVESLFKRSQRIVV